jgi:hypothetical protein
MNAFRFAGTIAGVLILGAMMAATAPRARAQDADQPVKITFREAVRIPGQVLPAGTYIFKRQMEGAAADGNLIRISNADDTRLIAFIQTLPVTRENVTGSTVLTFVESSKGRPPVLVEWFYPGSLQGHEFLYSKGTEQHVEKSKQVVEAANSQGATVVSDVSGD